PATREVVPYQRRATAEGMSAREETKESRMPTDTDEETRAANKAVVGRFNKEVIEQGNETTFRELMADDFVNPPRKVLARATHSNVGEAEAIESGREHRVAIVADRSRRAELSAAVAPRRCRPLALERLVIRRATEDSNL